MAYPHIHKHITGIGKAVVLLALSGGVMAAQAKQEVLPLPGEAFRPPSQEDPNVLTDLTHRFVGATSDLHFELPDSFVIENQGGEISYDGEHKSLIYSGNGHRIRLRADNGLDVEAERVSALLSESQAKMDGAISIYQGEMLARAKNASYDWRTKKLTAQDFRTKVNGLIIHGDSVEYGEEPDGRQFISIRGAKVSTDDVEEPSVWLTADMLKVYPGDIGKLKDPGIEWGGFSTPGLGITLTHSLNPEEGYLPGAGTRGIWGTYLLNRYGFLIGNRRVERGMPVADYVVTTRADYRTRRGLALGLDAKDCKMRKEFDMQGLSVYYIADQDPDINPTNLARKHIENDRYRVALQTMWVLPVSKDKNATWTAQTNLNLLSDQYVLRDYFNDLSAAEDKPDNTMRITRVSPGNQTMLWTRVAPNNFYSTDQRVELTHYHVRSIIGTSRIAYEGRNGIGVIRQYVPLDQRVEYRRKLDQITDEDERDYYTRMANTSAYLRANSSHEFSTSFSLLNALNITPKAGVGYSGYYGVDGVGADNRFLGYMGCNFDLKFHRRFESVILPWMGGRGLTHVIRPYVNLSLCSVSSTNPRTPRVDVWSTTLSNSSSNPMELDLIGFTNIDSWGTWSICRFGIANNLTTSIEGEAHTLLSWNCFLDYNAKNPNTQDSFSNLFTTVTLRPSKHYHFSLQAQTPFVTNGDGFSQYNSSFTMQPCSWFEGTMGHSYISGHKLIRDASQLYVQGTIRLNEKTTLAGRVYWDIQTKRIPIQQYGVFRKWGPWYVGASLFLRDNGGKRETGFGISFTLTEIGTGLPLEFL